MGTSALVLFSGGQDSTVCLAHALSTYDFVETVGFDYAQRHSVELESRKSVLEQIRVNWPEWDRKLGQDEVLNASVLGEISQTSLTRISEIRMEASGLPSTFVPGRNLLFFTLAGAIAYRRDHDTLIGGMCETDYSGYPDCRRATLDSQEETLCLGMDRSLKIETPLMYIDKAETWRMAERLGGNTLVELIIEHTHTCYLGDRSHRHEWGYGCGTCPACELRANGYRQYISGR